MKMNTQVVCDQCGCDKMIPIIYGTKQPGRDIELSLQEKLLLNDRREFGFGKPLWACEACHQPFTQVGYRIGESETESEKHFRKLDELYGSYVELNSMERDRLIGRAKIRELISALAEERVEQARISSNNGIGIACPCLLYTSDAADE